jgi:peptidoglycan/xylan/chitin deacetylase (PgdA/CDA1 family)
VSTVALQYHEIQCGDVPLISSDPGAKLYCVTEEAFRSQLSALSSAGKRTIPVGQFLSEAPQGGDVILTFDDGCATDLLVAAPALRALRFGATFFVTAARVGRAGYLSAAQLRELYQSGFEIGAHGLTHRVLPILARPELDRELAESRSRLEDVLGAAVLHLSYPGGRYDRSVVLAAKRAGYRSASTSRVGMNTQRTDRFRLRRVAITRSTTPQQLVAWTGGERLLVPWVRDTVLLVAKQVLGHARYDRIRNRLLGP